VITLKFHDCFPSVSSTHTLKERMECDKSGINIIHKRDSCTGVGVRQTYVHARFETLPYLTDHENLKLIHAD